MIRRAEMIGFSAFIIVYVFGLLMGVYSGMEKFTSVVLFSMIFFISLISLIIMTDKLDLECAKIDFHVAVASLISVIIFAIFVLLPTGNLMRLQLSTVSVPPTVESIIYIMFFNSLSESFLKFAVLTGLVFGGIDLKVSMVITAAAFSFLHIFRYGLVLQVFIYLFIMGLVLLYLARLPKYLGSDVELSLYPTVLAHAVHNLGLTGASLLIWW